MKTKILMVALMLLAMTPAIQAKSSTKTVAHRGYWKCEGSAENSLASLRKAHDVGCLVLELKTQSTPERNIELAKKVVDMVKSMKMEGQVEYIAFSNLVGTEIIRLDPNAKVAYLNGDKTPAELKELGYTGLDYHQKVLKNNKSWIREAHDLGLTVNVWTVNKADDLQYFIDEAADFITTNEPELLLDLLKK